MRKALALSLAILLLTSTTFGIFSEQDVVEWDIVPFSTDFLPGDVDNDGVIDSADITLLRRYIAAGDKVAFLDANPDFNEANADINGDGMINAESVARLRQYVAGFSVALVPSTVARGVFVSPLYPRIRIGEQVQFSASVFPSTANQNVTWSSTRDDIVSIRPDGLATSLRRGTVAITARSADKPSVYGLAGVSVFRHVTVDLFAESVWRNHYGSDWRTEAEALFADVKVPFYSTWHLDLIPTTRTISMPWAACPNISSVTNRNCTEARGCGSGASCRTAHHTSAVRIANHSLALSSADLSLVLVGHGICDYDDDGHSDFAGLLGGIARRGQKGAVSRGYYVDESWAFGYRNETDPKVHRRNTIRTMQHELSHNYGADHCEDKDCIMGPDTLSQRDNLKQILGIWCSDCKDAMKPNINLFGGPLQ